MSRPCATSKWPGDDRALCRTTNTLRQIVLAKTLWSYNALGRPVFSQTGHFLPAICCARLAVHAHHQVDALDEQIMWLAAQLDRHALDAADQCWVEIQARKFALTRPQLPFSGSSNWRTHAAKVCVVVP